MGRLINFPVKELNLRLLVMDSDGAILEDIINLDTYELQKELQGLHYKSYTSSLYHIKVCRGNQIILNRLFFPSKSNEKEIIKKVVMGY